MSESQAIEAPQFSEESEDGRTALYRLYDADDGLLYIGISDDPVVRMQGHAADKPWWSQVARKTAVWYPYRTQAETAETIAIGLEQPRYNKAKRYVRLPEQSFPNAGRPRPAPSPRAPRLPRKAEVVDGDGLNEWRQEARAAGRNWLTGHPHAWPVGMWCRVWQQATQVDVFVMESILCRVGGHGSQHGARAEQRGSAGQRGGSSWAQQDDPKASRRWPRYETSWSAHCWANTPLDAVADQIQRRFLYALLAEGRCSAVQLGSRAWAAGFFDQYEAQVVGAVLLDITWGLGRFYQEITLATSAIKFARRGHATFTCTECGRHDTDDAHRTPICRRCHQLMTVVREPEGD